jgi:hypothetical protein
MRTKFLNLNEFKDGMPRTVHLIKQLLNIFSLTEDILVGRFNKHQKI